LKPASTPEEKLDDDGLPAEHGYAAWKLDKVERALAQAQDRSVLVPAKQIWRELGLAR